MDVGIAPPGGRGLVSGSGNASLEARGVSRETSRRLVKSARVSRETSESAGDLLGFT